MNRAWYDWAPALIVGLLFLIGGIRNEKFNQKEVQQLIVNYDTIMKVREQAELALSLNEKNAEVLKENQRIHLENNKLVHELRDRMAEIKGKP